MLATRQHSLLNKAYCFKSVDGVLLFHHFNEWFELRNQLNLSQDGRFNQPLRTPALDREWTARVIKNLYQDVSDAYRFLICIKTPTFNFEQVY